MSRLGTPPPVSPAFYSANDTKTPVIVAGISLVMNIVLNIIFLDFFFRRFQNGGPALATAISCYFDFFALFAVFRLRYGALGTMQIFRSFARIGMCSLVMGVFCWFGARYTEFTIHSQFYVQLLIFGALISGATVIYLAMAWIFKLHEIEEVYGIALRNRPAAGEGFSGS